MSDDLVMRLNALADARHDDLDVAAEAAQRIISVTLQLMEAHDRLAEAALPDELRNEIKEWLMWIHTGGNISAPNEEAAIKLFRAILDHDDKLRGKE